MTREKFVSIYTNIIKNKLTNEDILILFNDYISENYPDEYNKVKHCISTIIQVMEIPMMRDIPTEWLKIIISFYKAKFNIVELKSKEGELLQIY